MKKPSDGLLSDLRPSVKFSTLGSLLSEAVSSESRVDESIDPIFDQDPVDLKTFLYDPDYLNLSIRLSEPQIEFISSLSNIFDPPLYTEGVLQAGQGSGKDTCSIFINLRIIYLLQCLKSPQRYFNMDENSFIDSINVAPNADLAKNIYFMTLSNIVRNAPLFQEGSPHYIRNKMTSNMVTFPKNVRLISGNSENESWQGYTPILIVLDEIDAFKSTQELRRSKSLRSVGADGIYDTAKSLVQSRFPGTGKIISLSWPRFKGAFIQKRFAAGKKEAKTYVACRMTGEPYTTWEFNPSKRQSDFQDFYDTDPVLAKARFECDPPFARDAFIKNPLPVLRAFDAELNVETDEIEWMRLKPIRELAALDKKHKYFIHVDLGLSHSNAALGIAHRGDEGVVLDLVETWIPELDKEINFKDIEQFIIRLKEDGYKIVSVTYDNYQSISSLQELQNRNIPAKYKSVTRTREAYDTLKDLIYQEKLDGYFDKDIVDEILGLDLVYGERVEPRPGMKKDRADAVAGAVHGVLKEKGVVTGIKEMSNVGTLFTNPDVIEREDKKKAPTALSDPKRDFGLNSMKDRIVSSSNDTCETCNRIGGLEFSDVAGSRLMENSDAAQHKSCIICGTKWEKTEGSWESIRDPDEELLETVVGNI